MRICFTGAAGHQPKLDSQAAHEVAMSEEGVSECGCKGGLECECHGVDSSDCKFEQTVNELKAQLEGQIAETKHWWEETLRLQKYVGTLENDYRELRDYNARLGKELKQARASGSDDSARKGV
jgi:predicted nuclease with TOPRIM domain